jgi:SynChlorMet cassette protein ScmD
MIKMRAPHRISPQDKTKGNPTIVLREEFDNQAFLYDPDTGNTYDLNPVGAFVWKCLDDRCSIGQIADKLIVEFETGSSSVIGDLNVFLCDLKDRGFIE